MTPKLDRRPLVSKKRTFDFWFFLPNTTDVEVFRSSRQKVLSCQGAARNSPNREVIRFREKPAETINFGLKAAAAEFSLFYKSL